jgi:hypothetical protein
VRSIEMQGPGGPQKGKGKRQAIKENKDIFNFNFNFYFYFNFYFNFYFKMGKGIKRIKDA